MIRTYIYVTDTMEFVHQYKDAPAEVEYLRNLHRHLLHIECRLEVFNNDREVEFIMLKHQLHSYLNSLQYDSNCSCEELATLILEWLRGLYSNREVVVKVSEDGENGVVVNYF